MTRHQDSTAITRVACAILFIVFTYVYLRFYQADVLAMAQHILSDGVTSYQRDVGAVLLTLILSLLAWGVYALTKLKDYTHALVYFPSFLLLAFITSPNEPMNHEVSYGPWAWILPLSLGVYILLVIFAKKYGELFKVGKEDVFHSPVVWINLGQILLMFVMVMLICNHQDVFHYRMRMESLMIKGDYRSALRVGRRSLDTDSSLTMLRIACLEKTDKLGERLFTYPLEGRSAAMQANGTSVRTVMWKDNRKRHTIDYMLTKFLLDKDIDGFAKRIRKCYQLDSAYVPKHFREALVLYTHMRGNPSVVYHDNVMDADFQDYQALAKSFADSVMRANALRDTYGNTYWYYYQYAK